MLILSAPITASDFRQISENHAATVMIGSEGLRLHRQDHSWSYLTLASVTLFAVKCTCYWLFGASLWPPQLTLHISRSDSTASSTDGSPTRKNSRNRILLSTKRWKGKFSNIVSTIHRLHFFAFMREITALLSMRLFLFFLIRRFKTWEQNSRIIKEHNLRGESYRLAINQFGDLSNDEFRAKVLDAAGRGRTSFDRHNTNFLPAMNVQPPASIDWRKEGFVTAVKRQVIHPQRRRGSGDSFQQALMRKHRNSFDDGIFSPENAE